MISNIDIGNSLSKPLLQRSLNKLELKEVDTAKAGGELDDKVIIDSKEDNEVI